MASKLQLAVRLLMLLIAGMGAFPLWLHDALCHQGAFCHRGISCKHGPSNVEDRPRSSTGFANLAESDAGEHAGEACSIGLAVGPKCESHSSMIRDGSFSSGRPTSAECELTSTERPSDLSLNKHECWICCQLAQSHLFEIEVDILPSDMVLAGRPARIKSVFLSGIDFPPPPRGPPDCVA